VAGLLSLCQGIDGVIIGVNPGATLLTHELPELRRASDDFERTVYRLWHCTAQCRTG
jgi:hypothetical protein